MDIQVADDFDLERIAESGQCFRWHRAEDGFWRIVHAASCLYIADLGEGAFRLECTEEDYCDIWHSYFDLDESYRAIRDRIDPVADPFLAHAATCERGIRILRQDPWEVLVSFIISQNRNIQAIQRSIELLSGLAGKRCEDARGQAYYAFPTPEAVANLGREDLASCKLGYRDKYVAAAAHAVLDGAIDLDGLAQSEGQVAIEALTSLYGVGIKVASCVALFGLHHLDSFPVDVWINRVLENEYKQGFPFERYRPYNGVFQQYLFACYRNRG